MDLKPNIAALIREGPTRSYRQLITAVIFGDQIGIILFLGGVLFFSVYWRIGFFITDNWTIANTFYAITDGQLYVDRTIYGPPRSRTPGYHVVEGQFFGRNYGQLILSLPTFVAVRAIAIIADPRIAFAGAWSLLLIAFGRRIEALVSMNGQFVLLASLAALVVFGVNTAFALPLSPRLHHLMAIQLSTLLFAAMIGVLTYRLITDIHDKRTGLFVGSTVVLATPIAFWASIPKRHILVSFFALVTLFAFYKSRPAESQRSALLARSVAYVSVGFWAWVHAPEALAMLVVLVPFDLATAQSNSPRRLIIVGVAFLSSLIPFFVTNWLISGNPVKPPRFISRSGGDGGGPGPGTGESPSFLIELLSPVMAELSSLISPLSVLTNLFLEGASIIMFEPARFFHTFFLSAPALTRATATDLTVLESTPIFGLLIAIPIFLIIRRRSSNIRFDRSSSVHQTDAFAFTFVVAFTLLYMSRLPLHAMWTVRYLLPIVPFGMYAVGRLGPVRDVISHQARLLIYNYAVLVLIGGQLLVVYLVSLDPSQGEVIQLHGTIGIIAAAIVGIWMIIVATNVNDDDRIGAFALSIALASGTLFVLLSGIEYFTVNQFALAMTELLSDAIPLF